MKDEEMIAEIMAEMDCTKRFACAEEGFETLCQARDFGPDEYLECLESNPPHYSFSLEFGFGHLCRCPLRVYLEKNR